MLDYYTVRQVAEFMDVIVDEKMHIYVNNKQADMETHVYENFSIVWTMETLQLSDRETQEAGDGMALSYADLPDGEEADVGEDLTAGGGTDPAADTETGSPDTETEKPDAGGDTIRNMQIFVNGSPVVLRGKSSYIFVDLFDFIDFDLSRPQGKSIVTKRNGGDAQYMEPLSAGDTIEIYWRD